MLTLISTTHPTFSLPQAIAMNIIDSTGADVDNTVKVQLAGDNQLIFLY